MEREIQSSTQGGEEQAEQEDVSKGRRDWSEVKGVPYLQPKLLPCSTMLFNNWHNQD